MSENLSTVLSLWLPAMQIDMATGTILALGVVLAIGSLPRTGGEQNGRIAFYSCALSTVNHISPQHNIRSLAGSPFIGGISPQFRGISPIP